MELPLDKLIEHEVLYFRMAANVEKTPAAWFLRGPELPDYGDANRALRLRDDGRGPETVAREVIARFRGAGLPVVADVDAVAEAQGIGSALRRLGVTPVVGDTLLMRYAYSEPPVLPPSSPIEVKLVPNERGGNEARDWIETVVSDDLGAEDEARWRTLAQREARMPECRLYLGLVEGRPAGACDLFSAEGWGRIDSVVTRPEFRRRGVASAVVVQAVADSQAQGHSCTYLFTAAGGSGERVYARLGFVVWGVNILRRHIGR